MTAASPKFRAGDRVVLGRGGFGRPPAGGVVAADWTGLGRVSVIPDGKTKARPMSAASVRLEQRAAPPGKPLRVARAPSTKPAKLRAVPKPNAPARSERYLAFVRSHACCACQRRDAIDPHHWAPPGARRAGMGQKVSDFLTVPLCRRCHDHFHESAPPTLPGLDARTSYERILAVQVELMDEWLSGVLRRTAEKRSRTTRSDHVHR